MKTHIQNFIGKCTALLLAAGLADSGGCASPRHPKPLPTPGRPRAIGDRVIGIDMYHGAAWDGLLSTLQASGFHAVVFDAPLDARTLQPLQILVLGYPRNAFTPGEIQAIKAFVLQGGGLLCAGQAWSWISYDKQPIEDYPLNLLGREMNFWVTDQNIGAPAYWDTEFMRGIPVMKRIGWWPSRVEFKSPDARPLIRDERMRIMAGTMPFGKGKIVLYGHDGLLQENPQIVENSIAYLMGKK